MIDTYSIQDVSRLASVSKHTLRFWEKTLSGVIVPLRTKGGQRRYTVKHLQVITEIKKLKQNGLSLSDIKVKMDKSLNQSGSDEKSKKIDLLANQIAEVVKASIYDFMLNDKEV
ncbi:MAG: MerR family transcriptional regulator [Deltaproteobacteria bacterium]|nr:MerR family transcriptional regulator [Deltaproteobacteria bacterium]